MTLTSHSSSSSPSPPPERLFRHSPEPGSRPSTSRSERMSLPSLLTVDVPVLRQPVGFGRNDPSASVQNTYQATIPPTPTMQFLPGQGIPDNTDPPPGKKKSSKGKEKEQGNGSVASASVNPSSNGRPPGTRTAFRVQDYDHDPRASEPYKPKGLGPYRADFRVPQQSKTAPNPPATPRRPTSTAPSHRPSNTPRQAAHPPTSTARNNGQNTSAQPLRPPPATTHRSAASYYRHDYERERSKAPSNHPHHSKPPNLPPVGRQHAPPATSYPPPHISYGANYQYTGQPSPPDSVYTTPSPAAHNEQYSPAIHQTSHPHNTQHGQHPSQASPPSHTAGHTPAPSPAADLSAKSTKVLRVLTLLIEDTRGGKTENLLAEVRVPLKQDDASQGGFWADAQDVAEALQSSTARIDGRAKVSTKRGKWKQVFLRVSPEDGNDCTSANLRVSKERTLEVFIEDYPAPDPPPVNRSHTPTVQRELLTPVTDPMTSPSPGPGTSPQPFPLDNPDPTPEREYGSHPPALARKRLRSDASRTSGSYDSPRESPYPFNQPSPYECKHQPSPASYTSPTDSEPSPHPQPSYYSPPRPQLPLPKRPSGPYVREAARALPSPKEMGLFDTPTSRPIPEDNSEPSSSDDEDMSAYPAHKRSRGDRSDLMSTRPTMTREVNWNPPRTVSSAFGMSTSMSAFSTASSRSIFNVPSSQVDSRRLVGGPQPRVPSATLPTAISHGPADTAVSMYLKSVITKEPGWAEFVRARNSVISVAKHLEQYRYVQSKFDQYTSNPTFTPADVTGAPGVMITRAHILMALGLKSSWSDDCEEISRLYTLYGADGERCEDPRIVAMFEETPPISTGMQVNKFLTLLREIDDDWRDDNSDDSEDS